MRHAHQLHECVTVSDLLNVGRPIQSVAENRRASQWQLMPGAGPDQRHHAVTLVHQSGNQTPADVAGATGYENSSHFRYLSREISLLHSTSSYPKREKPVHRSLSFPCLFATIAAIAFAQATDPEYKELDRAYLALRAKQYDLAIAGFERAIALAPDRPSIRKDLAYTLLKVGENEGARVQFAVAVRLDPGDQQVALEYAFLCYETKQEIVARRIFERYNQTNPTAAQAFENIDRPLREGIERWRRALATQPDNFSGHLELAHLAELRDELPLAAEHYEQAWRLRPDRRELLLDLGRVWKQQGRADIAAAALLAASRGAEPRVAEQAKELLPTRYPYVYEFEKALELDPSNAGLRRELGFLQLQMNQRAGAEQQFAGAVEAAPGDLLSIA